MGIQLIFVVETNRDCNSDWIYIKETIDRFYAYDQAHVKLSPVYMASKTKYKKNKVKNGITKYIKDYRAGAKEESKVIFCFDCDNYDNDIGDKNFLKEVKSFCKKEGYEYVWFCKDIERVYLGNEVTDSKKKTEAAKFKAKKLINNVDESSLLEKAYKVNSSNILVILDKFLERK